MTSFTKVTMNLTDRDVENTEKLKDKLHSRSNAEAVSAALSIATSLSDQLGRGDELIIKNKNGEAAKIIISGLNG